jgi:hypothetical protein
LLWDFSKGGYGNGNSGRLLRIAANDSAPVGSNTPFDTLKNRIKRRLFQCFWDGNGNGVCKRLRTFCRKVAYVDGKRVPSHLKPSSIRRKVGGLMHHVGCYDKKFLADINESRVVKRDIEFLGESHRESSLADIGKFLHMFKQKVYYYLFFFDR